MNTQVYDRFGSGLIVLIVLTIAVVASQAKPHLQEPAVTSDNSGTVTNSDIATVQQPSIEPIAPEIDVSSDDVADAGDSSAR
jgi:hypothetical protein